MIGRLIEEMPTFDAPHDQATLLWLGRADAIIKTGSVSDTMEWRQAVEYLSSWGHQKVKIILYRALGEAELNAPPGVRGAFIPVGNAFDAFAALAKLVQPAKKDVFIVDPYLDEKILTEFGTIVSENVPLRLLTDKGNFKAALIPAAKKWTQQYGSSRPLEIRLASPRTLHDRAIILDGTSAWTVSQSFKDIAARSPAEIINASEIASLKIAAYQQIWNLSEIAM